MYIKVRSRSLTDKIQTCYKLIKTANEQWTIYCLYSYSIQVMSRKLQQVCVYNKLREKHRRNMQSNIRQHNFVKTPPSSKLVTNISLNLTQRSEQLQKQFLKFKNRTTQKNKCTSRCTTKITIVTKWNTIMQLNNYKWKSRCQPPPVSAAVKGRVTYTVVKMKRKRGKAVNVFDAWKSSIKSIS